MTRRTLAVSVVLASRDRPELLRDSVASILAGNDLPAELIVIDQSARPNSTLATMSVPAGCRLRYHLSPVRGLSRANNLGMTLASQDLIAFTHDDVIVEPDWLGVLVETLATSSGEVVVTGRVLPAADRGGEDGFAPSTISSTARRIYRGRIRDDVIYPMNLAVHRRTLLAVNGFDERLGPGTPYPAAEDNDLGYRLLEAGHPIIYEPAATVHHRAWRSRAEQTRLQLSYGRGQGAFYAKHLRLRDRYIMRRIADDIARNVPRVPRSLLGRGSGSRAREVAYLWGVATGMARWSISDRRWSESGS